MRQVELLVAIVVGAASCVSVASAQNVARGQALYSQLGCGTSSCHGANPAENLRNVLNGAGSPGAIEYAATVRDEMTQLLFALQTDASVASDLAAWLATVVPAPPAPPPAPPVQPIVEYVHEGFGHYFVTNLVSEMAALDSGTIAGWARTGRKFNAYASGNGVVAAVCRFFTTAFPPRSSHFYTPLASECGSMRTDDKDWQYEGETFFVMLADGDGNCASGLNPVYRLYNNARGGAPNHRYTTDVAVRTQMRGDGWAVEGYGPDGVVFCVPS